MPRIQIEASIPKRNIEEWETDPFMENKSSDGYVYTKMCINTEDIWEYFEYTGGNKKDKEIIVRFFEGRPPIKIRESFDDFHARITELELLQSLLSKGNVEIISEDYPEDEAKDNTEEN